VPAPKPRYLDADGEVFSVPCLVVEYVEGEREPAPADETEFVRQLAAVLAGHAPGRERLLTSRTS
jgi:aminoglycoside phosphotransferase (APT) family kinase protein